MYSLYKFKSRGIGIISNKNIASDTFMGYYFTKTHPITAESRFIYDGWVETNPLGRYINHNQFSNLRLVKTSDTIELYTNQFIPKNTELTIDYLEIVKLIKLPDSLVLSYEIFNYDYIEEEIIINKSII